MNLDQQVIHSYSPSIGIFGKTNTFRIVIYVLITELIDFSTKIKFVYKKTNIRYTKM